MFIYQPEPEITETRQVDGWKFASSPLPGCKDDVDAWFSSAPASNPVATLASNAALERQRLRHRFLDLAQQWEDETGHLSSPNQRMLHPSYQAIIGMGHEHKNELIDFLIEDMRTNRREWFWALSYLTQANPIKPDDAGRIDRMINAWVRWGEMRVRR